MADQVNVLKDIFGGEVSYFIQEGDTLGERMYQGIRYVLDQGYQSCVLIGTDIPEIRGEQIRRAFEVLKNERSCSEGLWTADIILWG